MSTSIHNTSITAVLRQPVSTSSPSRHASRLRAYYVPSHAILRKQNLLIRRYCHPAQQIVNTSETKTVKQFSLLPRKSNPEKEVEKRSSIPEPPQDEEPKFKLPDFSLYLDRWDIPWGGGVVAWGLVGWTAAFILTGGVLVPLAISSFGISLSSMTQQEKSFYILAVQAAETAVGIGIIQLAVSKFKPLSEDLFRIDVTTPLSGPRGGWAVWGGLGYFAAFPTVLATSLLCSIFAVDQETGPGTVDSVIPLLNFSDPVGITSLLLVTSVLAPLVEEYVFRGFLLASLTKWVPTPVAVLISSGAFAFAHLAPKDAPQLFALGIILGFTYARTRNLMTSITVHSLWNSVVLILFIFLQSQGVDLQDFLETPPF